MELSFILLYFKQNRENTEGCLKCILWKTLDKLGKRQKGGDLTQSYDKKPLHQQKCQKGKVTTQTTSQKSSIKQRLRTD